MEFEFFSSQKLSAEILFKEKTVFEKNDLIYKNEILNEICRKINECFNLSEEDSDLFEVMVGSKGISLDRNIYLGSNKDNFFSIIFNSWETLEYEDFHSLEVTLIIEDFNSLEIIAKNLKKIFKEIGG